MEVERDDREERIVGDISFSRSPLPHINSFLRPRSSLSLGVNLLGHHGNSQDGIMKDRN